MTSAIRYSEEPAYQRMVRRKRGYGTWQPFLDAEPVRQHLAELQANGLGRRRIAELAGLHASTVSAILYGRDGRAPNRRIRAATAHKILAVRPGASQHIVPGTGTARRIQALMVIGWPQTYIAIRFGVANTRISELRHGTPVTAITARTIADIYAELHTRNPADHGVKRQAITLVTNYAATKGWPGPGYWEDTGRIDDPAFEPADGEAPRYMRLGEDGLWLEARGLTREQAAERLEVSRDYLEQSIRRYRAATAAEAAS